MLTKRCYTMLKKLNKATPDQASLGYSMSQICSLTGLSYDEALAVAEHLENHGYLVSRTISIPNHRSWKESFRLTEMGRGYKELQRQERLEYIGDKWIDIFASIISLISLILSIIAMSRAG